MNDAARSDFNGLLDPCIRRFENCCSRARMTAPAPDPSRKRGTGCTSIIEILTKDPFRCVPWPRSGLFRLDSWKRQAVSFVCQRIGLIWPRNWRALPRRGPLLRCPSVKNSGLIGILVLLAFALSRWPGLMPLNFSAGYAIAFCCGVFRQRMPWPWALAVLVGTDVLKNLFYYQAPALDLFSLLNYGAFALIYALGRGFSQKHSTLKLAGGGLLGAIVFYLVTNTGAWIQNPEYAKTIGGWFQALTVGTSGWPQTWEFFRNTLLSGGLFTMMLAGVFKLADTQTVRGTESQEDDPPVTEGEKNPEQ